MNDARTGACGFLLRARWLNVSAFALLMAISAAACGVPQRPSNEVGPGQGRVSGPDADMNVYAGDPDAGARAFTLACEACHGPAGVGLEGLGKNITASEFVRELNDVELLAFVKKGRPRTDPLNTTGVDMPPKGGRPALSDQELLDIIAYIRSLQAP